MKKAFCIIIVSICMFAAFSQEADSAFSVEPVQTYGSLTLGSSFGFFQDDRYESAVFEGLSYYLNPYIDATYQYAFGDYFSVNCGTSYNLAAIGKGFEFYGDWIEGCKHWAGDATLALNILLAGTPFIIGLVPALYYACCGLDLNTYLYYHPFHNEWLDTKIGFGLSNEPSNQFDKWNATFALQPMAGPRAQVDLIKGNFIVSVFGSYSIDLWRVFLGDEIGSTDEIYLDKFTAGVQFGLKL